MLKKRGMMGAERYLVRGAPVGAGERPERGQHRRRRAGRLRELERGAPVRAGGRLVGARPHAHGRRVRLARAVGARVRPERDADGEHLLAELTAPLAGHLLAHALAHRAARARLRDRLVGRAGQHGARLPRAHQTAAGAPALNARLSVERLPLGDRLIVESARSTPGAALAAPRRQDDVTHLGGVRPFELAHLAADGHHSARALHRLREERVSRS